MITRSRLVAAAVLLAAGCTEEPDPEPPTQASPNASILPAPLASAGELVRPPGATSADRRVGMPVDSAGRPISLKPPPTPVKRVSAAEPLAADRLTAKDSVGLALKAAFRWADLPPRPALPDIDVAAVDEAKKASSLDVTVDLGYAGRMRLSIESGLFPLPGKTEIRARSDYYGHALVWPSGASYRVLGPGTMRALFAERRADATPVIPGKPVKAGGGMLLGLPVKKVRLKSNVGQATLSQAKIEGSGKAGPLLCRFLLDFIAIDPATDACTEDTVPLAVDFGWEGGGRLSFAVEAMENRQDLQLPLLLVPPPRAAFKPGELPPPAAGVFLSREALDGFLKRAAPPAQPPEPETPGEGLLAVNHTDLLQYVLLDGVPVAWLDPHKERYLIGPKAGRYTVAWRDFLGTAVTPPQVVQLPARVEIGTRADSGAP